MMQLFTIVLFWNELQINDKILTDRLSLNILKSLTNKKFSQKGDQINGMLLKYTNGSLSGKGGIGKGKFIRVNGKLLLFYFAYICIFVVILISKYLLSKFSWMFSSILKFHDFWAYV